MLAYPLTQVNPEQQRLIKVMLDCQTTPQDRFKAGHRLGRLGDPRPGVGVVRTASGDILPDLDWIEIPGGEFIYQEGAYYAALPTYYMARYPITVRQFAAFVESDGYTNPAYWTREGWAWREGRRQPNLWLNPKFHIINHPVVGVTWYEASAFCCWLAQRLGYAADVIRLPSEWEWEKAARGTDGRMYPWGMKPHTGYANFNETYAYYYVGDSFLRRTTAVGAFPQDRSPYGVMDMSGNVREWCLTPYHTIGRVLRGGGWFNNSHQARTVFRNWFATDNSDHSIGFRLMSMVYPGNLAAAFARY